MTTPARLLSSAGNSELSVHGLLSGTLCCQCGGSGVLRLDGQRYRTCMDCVGQGRHRPRAVPAAEVVRARLPRLQQSISGSASSSAA